MLRLLIICFTLVCSTLIAQTISPQVINSAGKHYPAAINGVYLSDNIGEPFTQMLGPNNNIIITQGFLQPFSIGAILNGDIPINQVSCKGKNDGKISVTYTTNVTNHTVKYFWDPPQLCPTNDCNTIDSLKPGSYKVRMVISYTIGGITKNDTLQNQNIIINDNNNPCHITIFNGVTPNEDGINDVFYIENITEFPKNNVQIYTRWGHKIFEVDGYNNLDKAWPQKGEEVKLPSSTYFYIITLGNGDEPTKGWVELIKN